jgi:hypothetical protein
MMPSIPVRYSMYAMIRGYVCLACFHKEELFREQDQGTDVDWQRLGGQIRFSVLS